MLIQLLGCGMALALTAASRIWTFRCADRSRFGWRSLGAIRRRETSLRRRYCSPVTSRASRAWQERPNEVNTALVDFSSFVIGRKPSNHRAGKAGAIGVPVATEARMLFHSACEAMGAAKHLTFPAPSCFKGSRRATRAAMPSARTRAVTLLGRCPLPRRQGARLVSFGIGGGKRIVVADHCVES